MTIIAFTLATELFDLDWIYRLYTSLENDKQILLPQHASCQLDSQKFVHHEIKAFPLSSRIFVIRLFKKQNVPHQDIKIGKVILTELQPNSVQIFDIQNRLFQS